MNATEEIRKINSYIDKISVERLPEKEICDKCHSLRLYIQWLKTENVISDTVFLELKDRILILEKGTSDQDVNNAQIPESDSHSKNQTSVNNRNIDIFSHFSRGKYLIALFILGITTVFIFIFYYLNHFFDNNINNQYKALEKYVTFSGMLKDTNGNPISVKTDVYFNLYDALDAVDSIYKEQCIGENGLVPNYDGSFSIQLGSDCSGRPLPKDLDTMNLYLGISVDQENNEIGRYPIASTSLSSNAHLLEGRKLGSDTSEIPYINDDGSIKINNESAAFGSNNGELKIGEEGIVLSATENSFGSIIFNPDLGGNVIQLSGNLGIGILSPEEKLDIDGNINLQSSVKFKQLVNVIEGRKDGSSLSIFPNGKISIGTTSQLDTLTVGGNILPSNNELYNLGSEDYFWENIYVQNLVVSEEGRSGFFERQGNIIKTVNYGDNLQLGSSEEEKDTIRLSASREDVSWINSSQLGIGTEDPLSKVSIIGNQTNDSILSITNVSNLSDDYLLKLSTGLSNDAKLISFNTNASEEDNGTLVGSIEVENGNTIYKTSGADFAEYIPSRTPVTDGYIMSMAGGFAVKASRDMPIIGVTTKSAGFVGNAQDCKSINCSGRSLIGLVGQIEVNVISINDDIRSMSPISVSSEYPGVGQLAVNEGQIIGFVVDSTESIQTKLHKNTCRNLNIVVNKAKVKCGKVKVLVQPQWFNPIK